VDGETFRLPLLELALAAAVTLKHDRPARIGVGLNPRTLCGILSLS
jgi:hypothetical protein